MGMARRSRRRMAHDMVAGALEGIDEAERSPLARLTQIVVDRPFGIPIGSFAQNDRFRAHDVACRRARSRRARLSRRRMPVRKPRRRAAGLAGAADPGPCESAPARIRSTCRIRARRPVRRRRTSASPAVRCSSCSWSERRPFGKIWQQRHCAAARLLTGPRDQMKCQRDDVGHRLRREGPARLAWRGMPVMRSRQSTRDSLTPKRRASAAGSGVRRNARSSPSLGSSRHAESQSASSSCSLLNLARNRNPSRDTCASSDA